MIVSRSCSWCHHMNPASEQFCCSCCHEAQVARLDCRCGRCFDARHRVATATPPVPLGGVIAEAIAALRRGESQPSPQPEEVTVTRKRKAATTPDSAPAAVGTPRTAVSAKLAAAIRTMDDLLLDEFGPYAAFAYAVMGGDGLIAASNAKHGVVAPIVADSDSSATEGRDAQ